MHDVPMADMKTITAVLAGTGAFGSEQKTKEVAKPKTQQVYSRKTKGWESLNCSACGNLLQISPLLAASTITCYKCGNNVAIKS